MKRYYESEDERNVKQIKICEYISEEVQDEYISQVQESILDESNSEVQESIQDEYESFIPSCIEKQVICKAMAMICRSNMSDWNCEFDNKRMFLREKTIIFEKEIYNLYNITIDVNYEYFYTTCTINYSNEKVFKTIYTTWETEFTGDYDDYDNIAIYKFVNEKCYIIFDKFVKKVVYFNPRNEECSWCYFSDARYHLNRIAF